jgi:hypothetical protein
MIKPDRIIGAPSLEAGQVVECEGYQRARPARRSFFPSDEKALRNSLECDADGTRPAAALATPPRGRLNFARSCNGVKIA